ncbi:hypothetical protein Dimus_023035 [Dionaea muscipula]
MIKRAAFARELGAPIIMHDYLTGGFTANTSLAHYCRDNGLLLHIHRAMHAVIDRQKNHGMHFRVLAKALRLSGGDHIHSGTVVGKLEGERDITLGFVDLLRDDFIEKDRARVRWRTLGHPWGNAPGAVANRVALEACVHARNEGRDLACEGNEIIRKAGKWSPELAAACEPFEFPEVSRWFHFKDDFRFGWDIGAERRRSSVKSFQINDQGGNNQKHKKRGSGGTKSTKSRKVFPFSTDPGLGRSGSEPQDLDFSADDDDVHSWLDALNERELSRLRDKFPL